MLHLIGRNKELFTEDINQHEKELKQIVSNSRFLVIGGAGSIGHSTGDTELPVIENPKSSLSESFRNLRTNLNYMLIEKDSKVILVSSTLAAREKPFVR